MNELVKQEKELNEKDQSLIEYFGDNVLNVNPTSVDYKLIINQILQYIDINGLINKVKKGAEYVVQIPAKFQEGFDAGDYWIMENKESGKLWPTLMKKGDDGKNQIVTPLGIKKQEFIKENVFNDITQKYHNIYLQQQISELSNKMEMTLEAVKRVELGQKDDRIGLLEAGKQGVMLALSQKDDRSRLDAISLAINNINIAQNQIAETLKRKINDFEPLPRTKVSLFFKEVFISGYIDSKDSEYDEIQDYLELYILSTKMLALSYVILGDKENAEKVFDLSVRKIDSINYSNLDSLKIIYGKDKDEVINNKTPEFLIAEKENCMCENREYDMLELHIIGDELLEAIEYEKEISKEEIR